MVSSRSPHDRLSKFDAVPMTYDCSALGEKERLELRDVLRLSIGDHANELSEEDLDDLGMTLLEATAVVLKARAVQHKDPAL